MVIFKKNTSWQRRMVSFILIFLMLASLLPSIPPAAARNKGDEDPSSGQDPSADFSVKEGKGTLHIIAKIGKDGSMDHFDLKVSTNKGLVIGQSLFHEEEGISTRIEIEYTFDCLAGIKGKMPKDGIDCNSKDNNIINFKDLEFDKIDHEVDQEDGTPLHHVNIRSKDGMFKANIEMNGEFEDTGEGWFAPAPIEMKIRVKGFEFGEDDTELALGIRIDTNTVLQVRKSMEKRPDKVKPSGQREEELGSTYLTYDEKAELDEGTDELVDVDQRVGADASTQVSFIYPRSEMMGHTFEMGILPSPIILNGDPTIYGATIAAVVTVFALSDPRVLSRIRK